MPQFDLTVVDPVMNTACITRTHALLAFDRLYGSMLISGLSRKCRRHVVENDGDLWTFRLRDGLRFHDGKPARGLIPFSVNSAT